MEPMGTHELFKSNDLLALMAQGLGSWEPPAPQKGIGFRV